jgi:uncharacterized protein (TIGR03067 family)
MRSYVAAFLGVLSVTAPLRAQGILEVKEDVRHELQQLQGVWRIEEQEDNGVKADAAALKGRTLFFGADALLVRDGLKIVQVAKLKVNPSLTPRTVNAEVVRGKDKGEMMLGIYELKGDTLRLCLDPTGTKRPTEYKAAADSKLLLLVCKRVPPMDRGLPKITGLYKSESPTAEGGMQVTEAMIERLGEGYVVTYRKDGNLAYIGVGMRSGDTFSMCWAANNQVGLSVYRIERGPRLVGLYTMLGGVGMFSSEVLTVKDQ